jgi:hypothetical protein
MTEIIQEKPADYFCSIQSREYDEEPLGSAPRADVWFLLEYAGRWGSKAFDESDLPDEVKAAVNEQLAEIPNSRLLLIKRSGQPEGEIAFFAALASATPPQLYRFALPNYEALPDIDLAKLAQGDAKYAANKVEEPIFVVCTNGLRDQCCALNGTKAYGTLSPKFGEQVWQSTHHGGHRFGANMLAMPWGLSYGRMDLGDAVGTVETLLKGELPLENLRGRSRYEKAGQAAEGLFREASGARGIEDIRLVAERALSEDEWEFGFETRDGGKHTVQIHRHVHEEIIYVACVGEKQAPLAHYELVKHSTH